MNDRNDYFMFGAMLPSLTASRLRLLGRLVTAYNGGSAIASNEAGKRGRGIELTVQFGNLGTITFLPTAIDMFELYYDP